MRKPVLPGALVITAGTGAARLGRERWPPSCAPGSARPPGSPQWTAAPAAPCERRGAAAARGSCAPRGMRRGTTPGEAGKRAENLVGSNLTKSHATLVHCSKGRSRPRHCRLARWFAKRTLRGHAGHDLANASHPGQPASYVLGIPQPKGPWVSWLQLRASPLSLRGIVRACCAVIAGALPPGAAEQVGRASGGGWCVHVLPRGRTCYIIDGDAAGWRGHSGCSVRAPQAALKLDTPVNRTPAQGKAPRRGVVV